MKNLRLIHSVLFSFLLLSCTNVKRQFINNRDIITNPLLPGYFADPTIIKDSGRYIIYATIDPWGGEELAVFETIDFKKFDRKHINWPTKKACTSPTSNGSMVWAPSVRKER